MTRSAIARLAAACFLSFAFANPAAAAADAVALAEPAVSPRPAFVRPSPEERRSLTDAARRAGHELPAAAPDDPAADLEDHRARDLEVAREFVRGSWDLSDDELTAAAAVLLAPGDRRASAEDRLELAWWVRRLPAERRPRFTRVIREHVAEMFDPLVLHLYFAEADGDAAALIAFVREAAGRDPSLLASLRARAAAPDASYSLRLSAVRALDWVGSGPNAVPLPDGTVDFWRRTAVNHAWLPRLSIAPAEALHRRGLLQPRDTQVLELLTKVPYATARDPAGVASVADALARLTEYADREVAILALGHFLDDEDRPVRLAAVRSLRKVGRRAAPAADDLLRMLRADTAGPADVAMVDEVAAALAAIGPAVAEKLVAAVPDLVRAGRADAALDLLSRVGPPGVSGLLQVRDGSDDPATRRAAVRAIARPTHAGPAAEAALAAILATSDDPAERATAAEGLRFATGNLRSPGRRAMRTALADADAAVRVTAAVSLAAIGPDNATAAAVAVVPWLPGDDSAARVAAAALVRLAGRDAPPDALPQLLRMSDNARTDVRRAAAEALAAIDPEGRRSGPAMAAAVLQRDPAMIAALLPPARVARDPALIARLKAVAADGLDAEVRAVALGVVAELER